MSSVHVVMPFTDGAEVWLQENVDFQDWQKVGNGIAIEYRFIEGIVLGLQSAGFVNGRDFRISS